MHQHPRVARQRGGVATDIHDALRWFEPIGLVGQSACAFGTDARLLQVCQCLHQRKRAFAWRVDQPFGGGAGGSVTAIAGNGGDGGDASNGDATNGGASSSASNGDATAGNGASGAVGATGGAGGVGNGGDGNGGDGNGGVGNGATGGAGGAGGSVAVDAGAFDMSNNMTSVGQSAAGIMVAAQNSGMASVSQQGITGQANLTVGP